MLNLVLPCTDIYNSLQMVVHSLVPLLQSPSHLYHIPYNAHVRIILYTHMYALVHGHAHLYMNKGTEHGGGRRTGHEATCVQLHFVSCTCTYVHCALHSAITHVSVIDALFCLEAILINMWMESVSLMGSRPM